MRHQTVMVRSVLSRSLLIMEVYGEGRDRHSPPRLSMMLLGNLLNRQDQQTAMDICSDIDDQDPGLLDNIRSGWAGADRTETRRQRVGGQMDDLCEELVRTCRLVTAASERGFTRDEQKLLHVASRLYGGMGGQNSGWRLILPHFADRSEATLRRDYDRLCMTFWRRNEDLLRHAAALLARDAEIARTFIRVVRERGRAAKRAA